jgi:hypothetical protein
MTRSIISAALGRIEALARGALARIGQSAAQIVVINNALTFLGSVFANNVEAYATTQSGASVSVTAPPITGLSGGVFRVMAAGTVTTSIASTIVSFQLFRDATAVGPLLTATSDATNKLASQSIQWLDKTGGLLAHTYSLRITAAAGTVSINGGAPPPQQQGSIVVEEQPL